MHTSIFDLMAALIADVNTVTVPTNPNSISKDFADEIEKSANELLNDRINYNNLTFDDKVCLDPQQFNDIINACKEKGDYLFYRSVLCLLDTFINVGEIINKYDVNGRKKSKSMKSFISLNDNSDETGIYIIPKVESLPNTFFVIEDGKIVDKNYKNANYWYDDINNHFHNIIYVKLSNLNGFKIKNVVIKLFQNVERDKIVIGLTPGCNTPINELMDAPKYRGKDGQLHFKVEKYIDPQKLTNAYINCLEKAKQLNADLLIAPEMLGTSDLNEANEYGYNLMFKDTSGHSPYLIITPSFWCDGDNYISIYSKSGKLIGKQHKQYGFELGENGERYAEDLKNSTKEILLLHIPGWGRMVFPICVDLLITQYRDILSRELKADFIICPSYSQGTAQFINVSGTVRDFDTRLIWINSCSALKEITDTPPNVGFVSVPSAIPDCMQELAYPLIPKCQGKCSIPCLFTATIFAKSKDGKHCNDVEVVHSTIQKYEGG